MKRKLPRQVRNTSGRNLSVDDDKRTATLVWATGSRGKRRAWDGEFDESLSMEPKSVNLSRLQRGAPLLASHNAYDLNAVIGVVESASIEGGEGIAVVRFASDPDSDKIFQKVKDGIITGVSVGYRIDEMRDVTAKGDARPHYMVTRWEPYELSLVATPFDANAFVRSEQTQEEFEVNIVTREGKEMSKKQDQVETELSADVAEERQRGIAIRALVRAAGFADSAADPYIENGVSVSEAKNKIAEFKRMIEVSERSSINSTVRVDLDGGNFRTPQQRWDSIGSVEVGQNQQDKQRDGFVDALTERVTNGSFKSENPSARLFRGMSMIRAVEQYYGRKLGESESSLATRSMSSSDFPLLLANVAEKSVRNKYGLAPRTWSRWAKSDTLRNYKTHDKLSSGDFPSLEEVQEDGEIKRGSFGEAREQVALRDYAKMLTFTRRALINDDLGEFQKIIAQAGSAAARLENQLVYAILTSNPDMADGNDLFHSSHANLSTPGALSDTTIGEAIKLLRQQSSLDGLEKLNLSAKYLICGPENEALARKYLAQINPSQSSNVNPWAGTMELIVDAEITSNDYFFAADQNLIDTVILYYLEGQEVPRVSTRINFETSSMDFKVEHACVAKAIDHRGLVKNANAS